VTCRGLFAKLPSLPLVGQLEIVLLQPLPKIHDHRVGVDRNTGRLQKLTVLWCLKIPVLWPQELTENCVCLANPCTIYLFSSSVTREYHLRYLNLSPCCSVLLLICSVYLGLGFWRDIMSRFFSVNINSRLVARSWKPMQGMLKILFRRCKQHQIVRKKTKGWSCIFLQWHPRRLDCDYLSDLYGLWRRMVTAHTLIEAQIVLIWNENLVCSGSATSGTKLCTIRWWKLVL